MDTSGAGEGELTVNIMHEGRSVPVQVYPEGRGMYRVTFTPDGAGIYSIKVYFAGMEVAGMSVVRSKEFHYFYFQNLFCLHICTMTVCANYALPTGSVYGFC